MLLLWLLLLLLLFLLLSLPLLLLILLRLLLLLILLPPLLLLLLRGRDDFERIGPKVVLLEGGVFIINGGSDYIWKKLPETTLCIVIIIPSYTVARLLLHDERWEACQDTCSTHAWMDGHKYGAG